MQIKESAEDYLEAILMIKKEKKEVRSVDVARTLGVSKPSVSVAMKAFRAEGYIEVKEDGSITLTPKGEQIAKGVYERHRIIAQTLMMLGVDEKTAYEDSCKIEHDLSKKSFQKIKEWLKNHDM